jgi:hypothetical protein
MEEAKARKKRAPRPPAIWVIYLVHRRKLGAPIRLAPRVGSTWKSASTLRCAARFATRKEAEGWAKVFTHPDYRNVVDRHQEELKPAKPKPPGQRQHSFPWMEK